MHVLLGSPSFTQSVSRSTGCTFYSATTQHCYRSRKVLTILKINGTTLVCSGTCSCGQILHHVKGILEQVGWSAWAVLAFQDKDVYFGVDRNRKP